MAGLGMGAGDLASQEKMAGQALMARSEAVKTERAKLAERPDEGGKVGKVQKSKVNFFPVKVADDAHFHLYTLVIKPCRWREFEDPRTDAKPPPPLTPLEKHEVLAHLLKEGGKMDGFPHWNNQSWEIVYDGNATLLTINPIPILNERLAAWNPNTGRPIPEFHFGKEQDDSALDEDTRGRLVTTHRFEMTLKDGGRPMRFRATLTPVVNKRAKDGAGPRNLFQLSYMENPHTPIAQTEYRITPASIFDAIFSQWCMAWESPQREQWYGRRPSVALANPYAKEHDANFKILLPNGIEVWYGLYFATRIGRLDGVNTPFMNLNTASGVMYTEQSFMSFAAQLLGGLPPNASYPKSFTASQAVTINRNAVGVKVRSTHCPRNYIIKAFRNDQTPNNTRFACEAMGGEISVADYFLQKYKHQIQFPDMGMVEVRTPKDRQTTWLPVEVLEILKKQEAKALPESAAAIMIKKLCTPAPERESRIMRLAQMARFGGDVWSSNFRIALTPSMHVLKSRILPPPSVAYKRGTAPIKDGVWNIMPLLEPKPIPDHSVMIFAFARIHPNIGKVASDMWDSLRSAATKLGMSIAPNIYLFNQNLSYDYDTIVKQICGAVSEARDAEKKVSMIMVLMKERNPALYSSVKYVGDHFLGIPSQCLLLKTVSPLKSMTASNILLKMNAKLGGANWQLKLEASPGGVLSFLTEPTLVMGVDVSHPKPGDSRAPSIASVVANTDRDLTKWNATIAVSKPELEDIPYFRYAFEKRMFEFVKKTKKVPRRILLFRDGVSESQYDAVMAEELREVKESIKKMYESTPVMPKLTFVICIKRHHVRLFPNARGDAVGKSMNVAPGTVVDTDVASPDEFDFWLMSHFGLQGTCRPTYYQVLYDENNLSSDQVQLLAYYLCHNYARCPRAVSYPAPTYYAHLASERARYHLSAEHTSREDSKMSSSPSEDVVSQAGRGSNAPSYTPTASYHSDALSSAPRGSSSSSTSSSSSSSSSALDDTGVKTPEDVYKGVSNSLHRLQLAATVSSAFFRQDNLYFM